MSAATVPPHSALGPDLSASVQICLRLESEVRALRCQLEALLAPLHASTSAGEPNNRMAVILGVVCGEFGVHADEILGRTRPERIVLPRHVAMAMAREFIDASQVFTGRLFNRDHGTILHALHALQDRIDSDPATRARVERVRANIAHAFLLTPTTPTTNKK